MANDRSISLRLAVTGAEESLRVLTTFGDTGQAALQRLGEKFGAAGAAVDSLGQRITARQRDIEALGQALDQVDRDRGGTGFVSGTGRDAAGEAQAYVQAERAKQEAVQATAAAEKEAAAASAQLRQAAETVRQSLDPMLTFQLRAAEVTDLQVAGTLREVEALNALAQAYARVPSSGVAGPSVPRVTAALPAGVQDYGDAIRMVGQLTQASVQAEQEAHDLAAAYEIDAGAAERFATNLAKSEEALRRTTEAELAAANAAARRVAASRPDLDVYGQANQYLGQQYQAPVAQVVEPATATGYLVDEKAKVEALTAARQASAAAKREDAAASEQAAAEGAKLTAVLDRVRGVISPLAEAERQLAATEKALAAAGVDAAEVGQYRTLVLGRARDAQRAINQELEGSGSGYRNISYVVGNLGNQFGDFFVQVAGGTSVIRALTQQLPQAAGAFALLNSSWAAAAGIGGAVIAAVGAIATSYFATGESAKSAAKSTDDLLQTFGVSAKTADEFRAGLDAITASQKDLVQVDLVAELDQQIAALKAASSEAQRLSTGQKSAAIISYAGPGPEATGLGGPTGDPALPGLQAKIDALSQAYDEGGGSLKTYRDAVLEAALAEGQLADQAAQTADKQALGKAAVQEHQQAIDLIIAKINAANGVWDEWTVKTLNQADAMQAATRAAKEFGDHMTALQAIIERPIATPRQQFITEQLKGAGLDAASIAKMGDGAQRAADDEATRLAQKADLAFTVRQNAQLAEQNKAASQQLTDTNNALAHSYDNVTDAGNKAAAAKARSLGVDAAASPEGQKAIDLARQQAEASARLTEVESARTKVASARAAAAKMADEDQAKADQFVQDSQDKLASSEAALAAARQGGAVQTREAIAARQAEQEVIQSGIVFTDAEREALVKVNAQRILNNQGAQDQLKFEQQLQALRDQTDQVGRGVGRDAAGRSLDVADLGGLSSRDLEEARQRADAVRQAIAAMPEGLRTNEEEVNQVVQARVVLFNAELAVRQQVAAVDMGAKAQEDLQRQTQLLEALGHSLQDYYDKKARFEAEDAVKAAGGRPGDQDYDNRVATEQTRRQAAETVDTVAQGIKERNAAIADAFAKPIEDIPKTFFKAFDDGFAQLNQTGKLNGAEIAKSFAQGIQSIGGQTLEASFGALLKPYADAFKQQMQASLDNGQNPFQAFTTASGSAGSFQSALAGGTVGSEIGAVGGTVGTAISGNPNTGLGGSVGGTAGGVIGNMILPGIGGIVGSVLGTALGSFIGGMFGGGNTGKNNDAQGFSYDPITGDYTKTDKKGSQQNSQAARGLTTEAAGALDILRAAGLGGQTDAFQFKVGNVSGTEYNGKSYASNQDAMRAAIRDLIDNSVGTISDTLKTVLANTKAENAQQLQQDIAFAGTYDLLTHKTGTYGQALSQLDTQYRAAEVQAQKLGLSTDDLAKALTDAEGDLRTKAVLGIKELIGTAGPFSQALSDLNDKFKAANDDAVALGFTTQQLADAQAEQTAKLREQYHYQAEALIGAFGPLGQAILKIRDNFDQARKIMLDLGESVDGLAQKQAEVERKAYTDAEKQLQQQLSGQSQSIRSFLDGLVNPLKQALSGLGPLSGYVAPQQALSGGIGQIRQDFRLASNDNVAALQAFPQEAQQFLQLARQNYGSGPQFAAFFNEIQHDLQSLYDAQKNRTDQVEAALPSTEQTAQQQLDVLQSGFQDTVDALKQLHDDWRSLNPGLAGPANVNAILDPGPMAAAFAPQLAAQQQGNTLIAGVSDAVRLGTAAQTDAIGRMTTTLADRLDRLERKLNLTQDGRLGRAA